MRGSHHLLIFFSLVLEWRSTKTHWTQFQINEYFWKWSKLL